MIEGLEREVEKDEEQKDRYIQTLTDENSRLVAEKSFLDNQLKEAAVALNSLRIKISDLEIQLKNALFSRTYYKELASGARDTKGKRPKNLTNSRN